MKRGIICTLSDDALDVVIAKRIVDVVVVHVVVVVDVIVIVVVVIIVEGFDLLGVHRSLERQRRFVILNLLGVHRRLRLHGLPEENNLRLLLLFDLDDLGFASHKLNWLLLMDSSLP